ncbi:MAG: DUF2332 domain-containing protein [Acidimicrobiia bacterium]|nr:DUF2332 domain-containing protein [Acidimicrobiia bacterium]
MASDPITDRNSPEAWRRWADIVQESWLCTTLARAVADDPEMLTRTAHAPLDQLPPNLLLGAVHYLLLGGAQHPVADWYLTVGGTRTDGDLYPAFRDFVAEHEAEVIELMRTRLVQTNEVRRSAFLYPAYVTVAAETGLPLAVIDAGTSAGFNLLFDRYAYSYSGTAAGDPDSALELTIDPRSTKPPTTPAPEVTWRVGLDQNPIDVTDPDVARWMEALVWGDQPERLRRLDAAIGVVLEVQPRVVAGDLLATLPELIAEAPSDTALCVTHSFVAPYLSAEEHRDLDRLLIDASATRPLYRIGAEGDRLRDGTFLDLTVYEGTDPAHRQLAAIHHHGEWIEWTA